MLLGELMKFGTVGPGDHHHDGITDPPDGEPLGTYWETG